MRRSWGIAAITERSPASSAARWRTSALASFIRFKRVASAIGALRSLSAPSAACRTSALASPNASVIAAAPLCSPRLPNACTTALRTSADGS